MDSLGDRMKKNYEDRYRLCLTRRTPVILRLDGKAFHTLTKNCDEFNVFFINSMIAGATRVLEEVQGAKCAYIQSDEVSILITDYDKLNTEAWYDYNIQKIASVSASIMAVVFSDRFNEFGFFDARVFNIPREEVVNYFIWRQKDWERNSINTLALMYYSHNECLDKNSSEKHEMLHELGINWNDLADWKKNGIFIDKQDGSWVENLKCPIFTEDRNSIQKLVDVDREAECIVKK